MSRRMKILVVVVALAGMLAIIGGTVYAASGVGSGSGWCPPWAQGNGSGCCGGDGEQLPTGSCH